VFQEFVVDLIGMVNKVISIIVNNPIVSFKRKSELKNSA